MIALVRLGYIGNCLMLALPSRRLRGEAWPRQQT